MKTNNQNQSAFTLMEVMMVLVIVGILVAIAYPSYKERIIKARRADGHNALLSLATLMEHYYTENNSYAAATTPAVVGGSATSPDANYTISVSAVSATSYTLSATPAAGSSQVNDTVCGTLTLTNLNVKGPNPTVCWR